LPKCDVLIIDEFDETILQNPYQFQPNSVSKFNGIWNLKNQKVIGLCATTYGEIDMILEEVVTKPEAVNLLSFTSEYEFMSTRSTLNDDIVELP
jgi:hypothetical protein